MTAPTQRPRPDDFGERITYLVRRLSGALSHDLAEQLRAFGLTEAQLSALAQLQSARGPLTGAELAQRSGVTAQSMSAAVAGLLDRGLVDRSPRPGHGRRLDVVLTGPGAELVERVQAATQAHEAEVDLGLDAAEQAELRRLLRKTLTARGLFLPPATPPSREAPAR